MQVSRIKPKIVQIMTAPADLVAVFREDDGSELIEPIDGLALLNDGDINPFLVDNDGLITVPHDVSNFTRYRRVGQP